jgi:hypothetical protein
VIVLPLALAVLTKLLKTPKKSDAISSPLPLAIDSKSLSVKFGSQATLTLL